jgi:hypothetical protein
VSTAIATAIQVWYALMWAIWGAPTSPLEYVALLGAIVLLVAAVIAYWKPRLALVIAIGGLILLWMWYGPSLYMLFTNPPLSFRFATSWILPLTPIALLISCSIYAVAQWRPSKVRSPIP